VPQPQQCEDCVRALCRCLRPVLFQSRHSACRAMHQLHEGMHAGKQVMSAATARACLTVVGARSMKGLRSMYKGGQ
jgi:hypothetical protein